MIVRNVFRSAAMAVLMLALGAGNAVSAEEGLVRSSGLIDQVATIGGSLDMVQVSAASRQAINQVAGKSIDVTGIAQRVEADSLAMTQVGIGSSQALNQVSADSPDTAGIAAASSLGTIGGLAGKIIDVMKKGR
jgi:hypothetical protein